MLINIKLDYCIHKYLEHVCCAANKQNCVRAMLKSTFGEI